MLMKYELPIYSCSYYFLFNAIFEGKVIIIESTFDMIVIANRYEMAFFRIEDQNVFIEPVI